MQVAIQKILTILEILVKDGVSELSVLRDVLIVSQSAQQTAQCFPTLLLWHREYELLYIDA